MCVCVCLHTCTHAGLITANPTVGGRSQSHNLDNPFLYSPASSQPSPKRPPPINTALTSQLSHPPAPTPAFTAGLGAGAAAADAYASGRVLRPVNEGYTLTNLFVEKQTSRRQVQLMAEWLESTVAQLWSDSAQSVMVSMGYTHTHTHTKRRNRTRSLSMYYVCVCMCVYVLLHHRSSTFAPRSPTCVPRAPRPSLTHTHTLPRQASGQAQVVAQRTRAVAGV